MPGWLLGGPLLVLGGCEVLPCGAAPAPGGCPGCDGCALLYAWQTNGWLLVPQLLAIGGGTAAPAAADVAGAPTGMGPLLGQLDTGGFGAGSPPPGCVGGRGCGSAVCCCADGGSGGGTGVDAAATLGGTLLPWDGRGAPAACDMCNEACETKVVKLCPAASSSDATVCAGPCHKQLNRLRPPARTQT